MGDGAASTVGDGEAVFAFLEAGEGVRSDEEDLRFERVRSAGASMVKSKCAGGCCWGGNGRFVSAKWTCAI